MAPSGPSLEAPYDLSWPSMARLEPPFSALSPPPMPKKNLLLRIARCGLWRHHSKRKLQKLARKFLHLTLAAQTQAQMKHTKSFSIKNFAPPKTCPPPKFFMLGFFLYVEGKGGPKHKELRDQGSLGGGLGRGFPAKFFKLCLFSGPD